ncbi:hypothetical protein AGMMS49960_21850 [Betaproteobacteria bacterium]|nr:hypothetical protein AGMMS49543_28160 [Betaproteobacteria bacterium]GHU05455.1 hypothetical protein AGMMS49960_21850 [Betaproteobacteria bacterium]GHU25115.1 hypothetical protein AGMMS50243_28890 [Betaproteobacteria bacterium]
MSEHADLNERMKQFRLASRGLFNHFFRVSEPYMNEQQYAWLQEERFCEIQYVLFQKQVAEPLSLNAEIYGCPQSSILVESCCDAAIPIKLNREINSGYWDYPLKEVDSGARLLFVCFFDWDQLDYRDNQYVCVQVSHWTLHPELIGKHGLIESQHVRFIRGT